MTNAGSGKFPVPPRWGEARRLHGKLRSAKQRILSLLDVHIGPRKAGAPPSSAETRALAGRGLACEGDA